MTKPLEALIAKIKKQLENFDTVILKEDEAKALIAALEQSERLNNEQHEHYGKIILDARGYILNLESQNLTSSNALLDAGKRIVELEKQYEDRTPTEWAYNQACKVIQNQKDKIAEIEASQLAVKLPKAVEVCQFDHRRGLKGQDMYPRIDIVEMLRAAGITVQGDE